MEIFRLEGFNGRLLAAEPDERSRYNFTIWFPYTRELVNDIQDGDLLAVPNFQSDRERPVYSILKITNVLPKHFALRGKEDTKSYPGYVLEAAKNIAASWIIQESEPLEDTTIIEVEAIPTNLQFKLNEQNEPIIEEERSMPMVGEEVKLLSPEFVMKILNRNIKFGYEETIEIGHLIRDEKIKIYIRVEDLIRTHFGIFGYTGVGKSNLLSTVIRKLLTEKIETDERGLPKKDLRVRENIKILLFDLMDEYTGLLIDLLVNNYLDSKIVYIDRRSLPKPVIDYLKGKGDLEDAIQAFLGQMYVPKGLLDCKDKYKEQIKNLFEKNRIKIWEEEFEIKTIDELIEKIWQEVIGGLVSPKKISILEEVKKDLLSDVAGKELTIETIDKVLSKLGIETVFGTPRPKSIIDLQKQKDLWERIEKILIPFLKEMKKKLEEKLPEPVQVHINDILKDLHNKRSGLYIFVASDPNKLREFAHKLGYKLYNVRRRFGLTYPKYPLILFVFDEADEFIPSKPPDESYVLSKSIIETITRRGRKFGIGAGLATQRSAYLDTNIMGQLHTYFISKLPRKYDRDVVAEAFGLPESEFVQTFKFRKGEWLLVSHDATGIESVPIPIYVENAEDVIREFLNCKRR